MARGDLPATAAVAPMPYLPVDTGAAAEVTLEATLLPLSAACMRTLMVSSGCIVLCDAARAVAPAMTSVTGNTDAMLPSNPVAAGAVVTEASTKSRPPRRPGRTTRRRGRLTRAWRNTGRPGAYCSADISSDLVGAAQKRARRSIRTFSSPRSRRRGEDRGKRGSARRTCGLPSQANADASDVGFGRGPLRISQALTEWSRLQSPLRREPRGGAGSRVKGLARALLPSGFRLEGEATKTSAGVGRADDNAGQSEARSAPARARKKSHRKKARSTFPPGTIVRHARSGGARDRGGAPTHL